MSEHTKTYSSVAAQNAQQPKKGRYDCQVEVHSKFKLPMKRYEIYEELDNLKYPFRTDLTATIQLPGLRAVFHAKDRQSAQHLKELLVNSPKIGQVKRIGEEELKFVVSRVPLLIEQDDLARGVQPYANVIRINIIRDQYNIQTGTRHIFVKRDGLSHIPRFLQIEGVFVHITYEGQPPYCEFCKTEGHERTQCHQLAQKQLAWHTKLERERIDGKTVDQTTREPTPMDQTPNQEDTQPDTAPTYNTDFPILEIYKQTPKRPRQEDAATDYVTGCCKIKLNNKRNTELCTCARKFFKCKCGKWFPEARYIVDFQCDNCDRTLVKCPPSCGRAQSLNKGEITQC